MVTMAASSGRTRRCQKSQWTTSSFSRRNIRRLRLRSTPFLPHFAVDRSQHIGERAVEDARGEFGVVEGEVEQRPFVQDLVACAR